MNLEELQSNFPHKLECSKELRLQQLVEDGYEIGNLDHWAVAASVYKVRRRYLKCPECRVKAEYVVWR